MNLNECILCQAPLASESEALAHFDECVPAHCERTGQSLEEVINMVQQVYGNPDGEEEDETFGQAPMAPQFASADLNNSFGPQNPWADEPLAPVKEEEETASPSVHNMSPQFPEKSLHDSISDKPMMAKYAKKQSSTSIRSNNEPPSNLLESQDVSSDEHRSPKATEVDTTKSSQKSTKSTAKQAPTLLHQFCNECGKAVPTADFAERHGSNCLARVSMCQYCHKAVLAFELDKHQSSCPENVQCCSFCYKAIQVKLYEDHLECCEDNRILCPHCNKGMPKYSYNSHLENCPDAVITCTTCGRGVSRRAFKATHQGGLCARR